MQCPQCTDFLTNSEKDALGRISPEISLLADKFAQEKAEVGEFYIDKYMMFYRIEYTRLYNKRKAAAISDYNQIISAKYIGNPFLCSGCKTDNHFDFNEDVNFCFHEVKFDENCTNCMVKSNLTGFEHG